MRIRIAILLGTMMCLVSNLAAQNRSDRFVLVREANTNKPVVGARVYWKGESNKAKMTDDHGEVIISKKKRHLTLVVEKSGKKIKLVQVGNEKYELDVFLEKKGATSVTASRWEQSINETPASIVLITREQIEQYGYLSLQEILESVPGVFTIDHRSESDVTIGIRGFWAPFNRNVMIQVNGVNMLSERQNDYSLNKINVSVEGIDRIEIVRGPMSVIYGAGAFFGVINIITNEAERPEEIQASMGYGSQNGQRGSIRYSVNKGDLKLSVNAMIRSRESFNQKWDDMVSDTMYLTDFKAYPEDNQTTISDYRHTNINPARYAKKHQSFNTAIQYNNFTANVNYAESNYGFSFLFPGPDSINPYKSGTLNTQLGYLLSLDSLNLDIEAKVTYMNSLVDATYNYIYDTAYTPGQNRVGSIRNELNLRKTILDSKSGGQTGKVDLDVIGGAYFNRNFLNNSIYNAAEFGLRNWYIGLPEGENLDTRAGYLQANFKHERLQIVAGARLEKQAGYQMLSQINVDVQDTAVQVTKYHALNDNDSLHFIPRLAIIRPLQKDTSSRKVKQFLKAMYGKAIKQASVVDNTNDILANDSILIKKYLQPEKMNAYELGYSFQKEEDGLELNLNVFRNNLVNLVTRQTIFEDGSYKTLSTNGNGALITNGIEFIARKTFVPEHKEVMGKSMVKGLTLHTELDVTYQNTYQANGNKILKEDSVSFSPNLLGNLNVRGHYEHIAFGMNLNYVGKMNAYFETSTNQTTQSIGANTPGYFRLGLNIRFKKMKLFGKKGGRWYVNIRGSNVLNKKYLYPTYTLNRWADKGMLGRSQQVLLSLGCKF